MQGAALATFGMCAVLRHHDPRQWLPSGKPQHWCWAGIRIQYIVGYVYVFPPYRVRWCTQVSWRRIRFTVLYWLKYRVLINTHLHWLYRVIALPRLLLGPGVLANPAGMTEAQNVWYMHTRSLLRSLNVCGNRHNQLSEINLSAAVLCHMHSDIKLISVNLTRLKARDFEYVHIRRM